MPPYQSTYSYKKPTQASAFDDITASLNAADAHFVYAAVLHGHHFKA